MSLYNLWMRHLYHVTPVTRVPRATPQQGNLLFGEIQFVCEIQTVYVRYYVKEA